MGVKVKKTSTLIETLSSLKIEQYVSVGMTLLACVISLILYFEAVKTRDPSGFYISLVVTTTLAVVADRIARFVSENRVMKELESFNPTKQDLHYIGDGNAGIDWFCENYSGVHVVRNTVFRPAHSNVSFIFANLDKFNAVARLIIGPHCVWHDLVVIDTDGDAQKFHGSLSDQQKKSHHVVQLNGDTPLFQMLILEFGNDKSAVLFGWGFDANAGSKVYSSTDNDTVRFFRDYYELLRTKHAATVPEPIPSSLAGHPTPIPNLNQEALIALSFYRPYANFGVQDFSRAASSSSSSSGCARRASLERRRRASTGKNAPAGAAQRLAARREGSRRMRRPSASRDQTKVIAERWPKLFREGSKPDGRDGLPVRFTRARPRSGARRVLCGINNDLLATAGEFFSGVSCRLTKDVGAQKTNKTRLW